MNDRIDQSQPTEDGALSEQDLKQLNARIDSIRLHNDTKFHLIIDNTTTWKVHQPQIAEISSYGNVEREAYTLLFGNRRYEAVRTVRARRTPPLRGLIRFADVFGLPTRKAIKAMAGDYDAEIRRLRRARRYGMARWNVCLAWGYACWFVLRSPVDKLLTWAVKTVRGS